MPIPWGPTGQVVYERTYSRTKPNGEKETWPETVARVVRGNLSLVYGDVQDWAPEVHTEYHKLVGYMERMAIIPAGRHLWASGVQGRQYLFNCHVSGWGKLLSDHFEFSFLRLMEGGGVGANYSTKHIAKYGYPRRPLTTHIVCDPGHGDIGELRWLLSDEYHHDWAGSFEVADSREGWAAALIDLIDTFMTDEDVKHKDRVYDVSYIRKSGSRLKTFGGTASGPAPFARMMHEVCMVLNNAWSIGILTPLHAMEIDHAIAECVVSGGNRRSARMSIVHWNDDYIRDLIDCKQDTGKHWTTNISVEVDDTFFKQLKVEGSWAQAVHKAVTESMLKNGEPGYWNRTLAQEGEVGSVIATNPCQPAWARLLTPNGIRTMGDIEVEDTIWSEDGWVKVINKTYTGIKQVNRYQTTAGFVDATENHRIVSNGIKVELKDAETIDRLRGDVDRGLMEPKDVMAGLLLGDGHVHHTGSYSYVVLNIGEKDQDYFTSEVAEFIGARHGVGRQYSVAGVVDPYFLPLLPSRRIPEESIGNPSVLRGLYSANGSVVGGRVTLKTTSAAMRDDVMVSLSALGIASYYTTNKPSVIEWPNGAYESRESYDVNIGRGDDILRFMNKVGFIQGYKMEKLIKILRASNTKKDKSFDIIEIESMGKHEVYDITVSGAHHTYWSDGMNVSNCGEIALEAWENCNLGHINMDAFVPFEKGGWGNLREAHKLMTRFLIRATYGDVNDPKQADRLARNRRIGVGHLGVQAHWAKRGVKYSQIPGHAAVMDELTMLHNVVRKAARDYAFELRIPEPVKVTTVAPTGTIAKLAGVSEGIHPIYARHFERRVRFSRRDPDQAAQLVKFQEQGFLVEDDVYDSSGKTAVVVFPTEDILVQQIRDMGLPEDLVESADQISPEDMLRVQATYQQHWADNAVSYTVNIPAGTVTPTELYELLEDYLPRLKGTTIMVDESRPQAPYTRITAEQYTVAAAKTVEDSTDEECASGACPVR